MLERVMHIIIKTLAYIFILLLFVLLFVRMSGFGRAIFEDKAKNKPQEAIETVLVVEEKESLLDISKDLAEQGIVDNEYPSGRISGFFFHEAVRYIKTVNP